MRQIGWALLLIGMVAQVQAKDPPGDYLTKEGHLKARIEVRELQGGFAGFTGSYYVIEPDGAWSTGPFGPRDMKKPAKASGKLTLEQLNSLANDFAKFELASLPSHGKPVTNPKVTEIYFGKKTSTLQPNRGEAGNDADKAIRARYQGIAGAVKALCKDAGNK